MNRVWSVNVLMSVFAAFIFLIVYASAAGAQGKFFSTPSRSGAEGAKQNAQMVTFQNELGRMNTCTAAGMIYAPTHPNADAGGCTSAAGLRQFQSDVAVSGSLSVSGTAAFQGAVKIGSGSLCNATHAGSLRYNATDRRLELCEGSSWVAVGSGGGGSYPCSYGGTPREEGFSYNGACGNYSPPGCSACGWTLHGTYTRYTCQSDGTWSETTFACSYQCQPCQHYNGPPGDAGDW